MGDSDTCIMPLKFLELAKTYSATICNTYDAASRQKYDIFQSSSVLYKPT